MESSPELYAGHPQPWKHTSTLGPHRHTSVDSGLGMEDANYHRSTIRLGFLPPALGKQHRAVWHVPHRGRRNRAYSSAPSAASPLFLFVPLPMAETPMPDDLLSIFLALFSSEIISNFGTVALSFLFDKYYPIID